MKHENLPVGTVFKGRGGGIWVVGVNGEYTLLCTGNASEGGSIPPSEANGAKPKEILGRLPPSDLDVKEWDEKYRLPKDYEPEKHDLIWYSTLGRWMFSSLGWAETNIGRDDMSRHKGTVVERASKKKPEVHPPGTIVRLVGLPNEHFYDWIVLPNNRARQWIGIKTFTHGYDYDWKVIGRLPPDQLDATEWRDEFQLPEKYDPEKHDLVWRQIGGWGWNSPAFTTENKQHRWVAQPACCRSNLPLYDPSTQRLVWDVDAEDWKVVGWEPAGECPSKSDCETAEKRWLPRERDVGHLQEECEKLRKERDYLKANSPTGHIATVNGWRICYTGGRGQGSGPKNFWRAWNKDQTIDTPTLSDILSAIQPSISKESLMSSKLKVAPTYMATVVSRSGGVVEATINEDSGSKNYPAGTRIKVKKFDQERPGHFGAAVGDIIAVRKTKLGGWKLVGNTRPPSSKESAIGIVIGHSDSHAIVDTGIRKIRLDDVQRSFKNHKAHKGDVVRVEKKATGWQVTRRVRRENIEKYNPNVERLIESRSDWIAFAERLEKRLKKKDAETSDASSVSTTAQKGRKGFMKKAAILLVAGALAGNLPISDMYSVTKGYFVGSPTIVTGEFDQRPFCEESGVVYPAGSNVVIDGETGSTDIRQVIAAPLYRERGFPLTDVHVGFVIRNPDGSTRILMQDAEITVGKDES